MPNTSTSPRGFVAPPIALPDSRPQQALAECDRIEALLAETMGERAKGFFDSHREFHIRDLRRCGPNVTVIGDRDPHNPMALADFSREHPGYITFSGLLTPGAELDLVGAFLISRLRERGAANGEFHSGLDVSQETFYSIPRDGDIYDLMYVGKNGMFSHQHCAYDKDKLRGPDADTYRRDFCHELIEQVDATQPDLIFLSNFKIVLHSDFVKAFDGKIVNVHPSALPLLKGYRTENRASNLGENAEWNGYTIHNVSGDLDGGATYFQQRVPVMPYDSARESAIGKEIYLKEREETARLQIILAQSKWVPLVLAVVASATPRIIVRDAEAFAVEGRGGFETNPAYVEHLRAEHAEWMAHSGQNIEYEHWHREIRKPYERVLFDNGNGYRPLEELLGAPSIATVEPARVRTRFMFDLPILDGMGKDLFKGIISRAQTEDPATVYYSHEQGGDRWSGRNPSSLACVVETSAPIEQHLTSLKIDFEQQTLSARANVARLPFSPRAIAGRGII